MDINWTTTPPTKPGLYLAIAGNKEIHVILVRPFDDNYALFFYGRIAVSAHDYRAWFDLSFVPEPPDAH